LLECAVATRPKANELTLVARLIEEIQTIDELASRPVELATPHFSKGRLQIGARG